MIRYHYRRARGMTSAYAGDRFLVYRQNERRYAGSAYFAATGRIQYRSRFLQLDTLT